MPGQGRSIESINVNYGCRLDCEACEKYFDCDSPEKENIYERGRMRRVRDNLLPIKYKVAVMSGKGGVGKSAITVSLAMGLAQKGYIVGVVDQDFDGPCIPRMLGVAGQKLTTGEKGILPVVNKQGIKVVSTGLLPAESDTVITWLHALRRNATEEFLGHTEYDGVDYLLIDMPPGTSSDCVNVLQCLPDLTGAVVVTVPTQVSQAVAKKSILLCRKAGVPILGVIENMSGYVCPDCGSDVQPLLSGGGEALAVETGVPFWGRVPIEAMLGNSLDRGEPFLELFPNSPVVKAIQKIVEYLQIAVV